MAVTVTTNESGAVPVVHVRGDVDVTAAPMLRDAIDALIGTGHQRLVLDLTEVTFIDSTGLGVVVGRLKGLRRSGGVLTVAASHERVLRADRGHRVRSAGDRPFAALRRAHRRAARLGHRLAARHRRP